MLADNNHKVIYVTHIGSGEQVQIFEFDDPAISMDYTVWSPDCKWILSDRLKQHGGDIWVIENFE